MRTEKLNGPITRKQKPFNEPLPGRTQGYLRSAIPKMIELANSPGLMASRKKLILNSGQIVVI